MSGGLESGRKALARRRRPRATCEDETSWRLCGDPWNPATPSRFHYGSAIQSPHETLYIFLELLPPYRDPELGRLHCRLLHEAAAVPRRRHAHASPSGGVCYRQTLRRLVVDGHDLIANARSRERELHGDRLKQQHACQRDSGERPGQSSAPNTRPRLGTFLDSAKCQDEQTSS